MPIAPYKIALPRAGRAPVIAHVPHASTLIGENERRLILLDDDALRREVARVTDWDVDYLFSWVLDYGGVLFVNELSRLVFDPERFADDALEPAAAHGQGVIYTHTTDGMPLATITAGERASRIQNLYDPYHEGFTAVVQDTLDQFGMALILDCHSFPSEPLPTEVATNDVRPDVCLGTDAFHTPTVLVESLQHAFRAEGFTVHRNSPFAGTLTPLDYMGKDPRVMSVMIEVRRDLYCDEATGERTAEFARMRALLERVVSFAVGQMIRERRAGSAPR
ncbi:MAG: N-formylglutamate amidohydrolase [Coriobacteriia bacterium]|nr:N-formylglutamate amidohydrolase [Coriobacteriia bacterium]